MTTKSQDGCSTYCMVRREKAQCIIALSSKVMRARHPAWFREDLGRLFELLATGAIRPRVADGSLMGWIMGLRVRRKDEAQTPPSAGI